MLQLELQREHLDVYGLPWAVVSQLDDQDSGQGWCVEEMGLVQGCGGWGMSCVQLLHCSEAKIWQ